MALFYTQDVFPVKKTCGFIIIFFSGKTGDGLRKAQQNLIRLIT